MDLRFRRRIALVIGNANYTSWDKLPAGQADATDIGKAARQAGFDLIGGDVQRDVDANRMQVLIG
ncbi:caspase family protein, partial [Acinetobacter baumannii]